MFRQAILRPFILFKENVVSFDDSPKIGTEFSLDLRWSASNQCSLFKCFIKLSSSVVVAVIAVVVSVSVSVTVTNSSSSRVAVAVAVAVVVAMV